MWPDPSTHTPDLRSCQQSSFTRVHTHIHTRLCNTSVHTHIHAQLCNTSEERTQTWLYNTSEEHTYTHPTLQHLQGERVHNFLCEQRTEMGEGCDESQCTLVLLYTGERARNPQAKGETRSTSMVAITSKVNVRTNQEAREAAHLWPSPSSCFLGDDSQLQSSPMINAGE